MTTLENYDFKAIIVLIKKNGKSAVTLFISLFSFLSIDSTIRHGCLRLEVALQSVRRC